MSPTSTDDHNAGLAIPFPYDEDVLALIAERVERVQDEIPAPFLLENNVSYIDIPDQDMTEPEFLRRLTARTGCGLLLDVHNVVVNATNHGFDAHEFVRRSTSRAWARCTSRAAASSRGCAPTRIRGLRPMWSGNCSTTSSRVRRTSAESPSSSMSRTTHG